MAAKPRVNGAKTTGAGGGETVLVTGGSGYIGGWCVATLLQKGYVVRTSVRDLSKEPAARAAIASVADPGNRLSFHALSLTSDDGWDAATEGCDYVLHVASPVAVSDPKNPDDLIRPAREGARRAVGAAIKAGVKRVVLTSSVAAANKGSSKGWTSDETVWSDVDDPKLSVYAKSKTLAERAAWEMIHAQSGHTQMATVMPALVLGPVMSRDFSESVQVVERLLSGRVPGLPRLGFNVVDVRDVAELHVRAMIDDNSAGERYIAAGTYAWMPDLAELMRSRIDGPRKAKIPTRKMPDFVIRLAGLFDKDLGSVAPGLGIKHDFTAEKAQRMLAWRSRPLEETIMDCANSLIGAGAV